MTLRRLIFLPLVCALFAGCAGYKLGPSNGTAAREKSVQVVPFTNRTLEPRLGDAVTAALRKQVARDGTFRLATREAGDVVVTGAVTEYRRVELSLDPKDVLTPRDFRVKMTVQVTATERATGRVLFEKPVAGYTLVRAGSDLVSAERQALPVLAEDVAKIVVGQLADGSW